MIESFRKMWKIPELRSKVLYTIMMLIVFRLVGVIPAPGVDAARLLSNNNASNLDLLQLMNAFTGGNLSNGSIMAMGITPYINASIIMQLLCIAIPALERLSKDENGGQEKIARISRYVTVGLALLQAIGIVRGLGAIKGNTWYNYILVGVSMAGGTALAMWMGERITEKGIGNGVSLLIFIGIISNLFNGIVGGFTTSSTLSAWINMAVIVVLFVIMTVVVTFVELGERRVPLQIAKQVKGRRVYGGQNTHMSLKVVSVGVLPLIFAYSFLAFPSTIIQLFAPTSGFAMWWAANMNQFSWLYLVVSALLIIAFTYFYSAISFDPKKQAEQLLQQGATIPGTRGKNIEKYLTNTVGRLNLFAALFLAVLSVVPTILSGYTYRATGISVPFAASSILIAVSVSVETIRTLQGEMSVRGIESGMNGFM